METSSILPESARRGAEANALRVVIVGDDSSQSVVFSEWLTLAGHRCHHFACRGAPAQVLNCLAVDALLLDWGPRPVGEIGWLRNIRGSDRAFLPVLLISERDREEDVASALRQGADDYLIKPVRRLELLARLEAAVRRGRHRVDTSTAIEVGAFRVDRQARTIMRDGRALKMTTKDFELAALFLGNVGRVLSRAYLHDTVWGPHRTHPHVYSRTLDTHVSRLRKKVGLIPENGWRLAPIYSRGYRLDQLPRKSDSAPHRSLQGSASTAAG